MSSSASVATHSIDSATRRLHRGSLRGVPARARRARLADSTGAARRSRGFRHSPGRARATKNGGGPTSAGSSSTPSVRPPPRAAECRGPGGARRRLGDPELRTTPPASSTSTAASPASPIPRGWAERFSSISNRAVKDYPELLEALSADRGRHARRRHLRGAARGVLDRAGRLLYVPKGVKLEAPAVQPDRPGRRGAGRPEPYARRARRRGRGHPRPRIGRARRRASAGACTSGRSRSSSARGRSSSW